ncbi:hypothetical protein KE530_14975 [Clostridiaceae bacterium Marseille-Q4145]|nr:hypothetical protein [Clostridiaceae bacterium Marseille-Q4145]
MEKTESRYLERTDDVWTRLRLARLQSVEMDIPDDAKTPEQMLEEIKKKISERT